MCYGENINKSISRMYNSDSDKRLHISFRSVYVGMYVTVSKI